MSTRRELYRDPARGKIAGVCAGIADYFGMETWLVRILVVSGFFLMAGPFFLIGYAAAWFILEKKPGNHHRTATAVKRRTGKGWHNQPEPDDRVQDDYQEERKVEVKARVWQAGEPPRQAYFDIKHRFAKMETRLRQIESYATSKEFQLNRELNKL